MRALTLLLCVPLAACAAAGVTGDRPPAEAANSQAAASAPAAAPPPAAPAVAAPAVAAQPASTPAAPPMSESQRLTQARVDCWMKVEQQKRLRDIDRRIAFVDKCVADTMKAQSE